ncbi:MAG: alpha/beta hydrolase [Actinomycetota bacterium]
MHIREDVSSHGVRERIGTYRAPSGDVPLVVWTPDGRPPRAVVAVGHGASGHKRMSYVLSLARELVREFDCAVFAIDGPIHGERRSDGLLDDTLVMLEFAQYWQDHSDLLDVTEGEWRAALDCVQLLEDVGSEIPVAYWGLSMGGLLGIGFVAREPRIRASVLGLIGATDRFRTDAAAISVPVLFLVQWHDELFSRESSLELFDSFTVTDRTLLASPGTHGAVPEESILHSMEFLSRRLLNSKEFLSARLLPST